MCATYSRNSGGSTTPPGSVLRGGPVLLLTTTGHKTGQERTWPLCYLPASGDELALVASAAGAPRHAAWYSNLRADPRGSTQRGPGEGAVASHSGDPRARRRPRAGIEDDRARGMALAVAAGLLAHALREGAAITPGTMFFVSGGHRPAPATSVRPPATDDGRRSAPSGAGRRPPTATGSSCPRRDGSSCEPSVGARTGAPVGPERQHVGAGAPTNRCSREALPGAHPARNDRGWTSRSTGLPAARPAGIRTAFVRTVRPAA